MSLDLEQKEFLRNAALDFLAGRPGLAFEAKPARALMVHNRSVDFKFTVDDLAGALEFNVGTGHAQLIRGQAGASKAYKATSTGIVHSERRAVDEGLEE